MTSMQETNSAETGEGKAPRVDERLANDVRSTNAALRDLTEQRDELLAALKAITDSHITAMEVLQYKNVRRSEPDIARALAAIAKVEGNK
jgi:uncharacterized protein YlxW (UPF0749 family)